MPEPTWITGQRLLTQSECVFVGVHLLATQKCSRVFVCVLDLMDEQGCWNALCKRHDGTAEVFYRVLDLLHQKCAPVLDLLAEQKVFRMCSLHVLDLLQEHKSFGTISTFGNNCLFYTCSTWNLQSRGVQNLLCARVRLRCGRTEVTFTRA